MSLYCQCSVLEVTLELSCGEIAYQFKCDTTSLGLANVDIEEDAATLWG